MAAPPPAPVPGEQQHYPLNVKTNAASLYYVKSTSASLSGAFCGLYGLTSLSGFAFYFISSLAISILFALVHTRGKPIKFFARGWTQVITTGIGEHLAPFVLFWTLFYSLVHIYD